MGNTELVTKAENTPAEQAGHAAHPDEEPSAEWGWHGTFPKAAQAFGWFSVIALLAMLFGNHHGIISGGDTFKQEDIFLLVFALIFIVGLLRALKKRRTSWRG